MRVTRHPSIHQLQPVDGDASRIGRSRGGQDRERQRQRQKKRERAREREAPAAHTVVAGEGFADTGDHLWGLITCRNRQILDAIETRGIINSNSMQGQEAA